MPVPDRTPRQSLVINGVVALFLLTAVLIDAVSQTKGTPVRASEFLQSVTNGRESERRLYRIACFHAREYQTLLEQYSHDDDIQVYYLPDFEDLPLVPRDTLVAVYFAGVKDRRCLRNPSSSSLTDAGLSPPPPQLVYRESDRLHLSVGEWIDSHLNTFNMQSVEAAVFRLAKSLVQAQAHADTSESCERVSLYELTAERFFLRYVIPGRPVVVRASKPVSEFASMWDLSDLDSRFGHRVVSVRAVPVNKTGVGVFEGCESAQAWNEAGYFLPEHIREQLESPEQVLVRPAILDIAFGNVLRHLVSKPNASRLNMSFYMEYFGLHELDQKFANRSAPGSLPFLAFAKDLFPFEESRNLWLGDGRTIGKLHFDAQDNLLVQLKGTKVFRLFGPQYGEQLYEGHLREAQFVPDLSQSELLREKFLRSTSMVNSPVDIEKPNRTAYPRYAEVSFTTILSLE